MERQFIDYANRNPSAEFEVKLLAERIQTRDVADRFLRKLREYSPPQEEHRMTVSFADTKQRVHVVGAEIIHRACVSKSLNKLPVDVERKTRYFEGADGKDMVDVPDMYARYTLRKEVHLRKDHDGSLDDPRAFIRVLHRYSFLHPSKEFRIDFSMVKSKKEDAKTLPAILKQPPSYELEIEYLRSERPVDAIIATLNEIIHDLIGVYQRTPYPLPRSELERYAMEFRTSGNTFYNVITLKRRHVQPGRPHSILKGYTVTNKADGERCGLYVARDKRLLRINNKGVVSWTGLTALKDANIGDFLDGEYLENIGLFCIFDIYKFKGQDLRGLPLFINEEQLAKTTSRLGCARKFVEDLPTDFRASPGSPMRIQTKLFLAGDGAAMEECIRTILDTRFEYPTDGLIFTPKASPVAPRADVQRGAWVRVYKWKPASQNSIDFLVRLEAGQSFDPVQGTLVREGTLFVTKRPGDDIVYPCETLTGEYIPRQIPEDLRQLRGTAVPAVFQPSNPRDPEAHRIRIPVNDKNQPVDEEGVRVEDNTIIECYYDMEKRVWKVMRTRYDKTYEYRVLHRAQFGNAVLTAEDNWNSIHVPITEEMIRNVASNPIQDSDDAYYRDDVDSRSNLMLPITNFHRLIVKDSLYSKYVLPKDTLLEFGAGRGGDLARWIKSKPSKVVATDYSETNLTMPNNGACVRYLKTRRENPEHVPYVLFAQADMTQPLEEQDNKYLKIVLGQEAPTTAYLERFAGISPFDAVSCQFAIHYACASEETFNVFLDNVDKHCKSVFFGTCLDGEAVYSLLAGKTKHTFRTSNQIFAEYERMYPDSQPWEENFGMAISVMLESFEKPTQEFLVPFKRIVELFAMRGFDVMESDMFDELYQRQSRFAFGESEQEFSFLHRTFAFRRVRESVKPEKEPEIQGSSAARATGLPEEVVLKEPKEEVEVQAETKEEVETKEEAEPKEEPEAYQGVEEDDIGKAVAEAVTAVLKRRKKLPAKPVEVEAESATKETATAPVKRKKKLAPAVAPAELPEAEKPVFFFSKLPENKEFSNFYEAKFSMDGVEYPSAEHAYQAIKAKTFGDDSMFEKIMKAKSAQSAKAFGRKVANFNEDTWTGKKDEVMRSILRAKFTQNPALRTKLMETGTRPIANADPRNKYWGIGTSLNTEKAKDPSKWLGANTLGKLLVELRDSFRAEV
jgi:ribA/ribD-fused uncharacterized protein